MLEVSTARTDVSLAYKHAAPHFGGAATIHYMGGIK